MRIRSTKPEFWRSERIASVSWDARLVLKGLESYVDDNGVGRDDIALIVGEVFPRDMLANPRETVARVSEGISQLSQAGLLWRYEVDGTRFLYLSWWESVQRIDKPGKGRFPRPDGTLNYGDSKIRESVAKCRESLAPGTGEQGNRGTGENSGSVQRERSVSNARERDGADRMGRPEMSLTALAGNPDPAPEPPPPDRGITTEARTLVAEIVPAGHPRATTTALQTQTARLLNTGTDPDVVAAALRLWCDKPAVGIGQTIMASLVSEVIKSRDAPMPPKGKPHKMRALVELAQQTAAQEARNRKELPA